MTVVGSAREREREELSIGAEKNNENSTRAFQKISNTEGLQQKKQNNKKINKNNKKKY
jgi:hypothetical protein